MFVINPAQNDQDESTNKNAHDLQRFDYYVYFTIRVKSRFSSLNKDFGL